MSIEGQGHFFTIYFPGFVCFVLYLAKISGERLQDHWSSGLKSYLNEFFLAFTLYFFSDNQVEANSLDLEKAVPLTDHCRPFYLHVFWRFCLHV